ncbi:MAG: flagellar basal body rod protein FlgB [Faecalimonas sp.]|nr:flagellar basal body rod protein FlgB [Faecalimonas sp.]
MNFGNTIQMSQKALDYLWKKQEITMDNIANISTPGYKAKEISFQDTFRNKLKAATQTGDAIDVRAAIRDSDYTVYERSDSARVDGNGVNVDVEYTELSRTALHYQYLLQSVNSDITRLRTAIKGQ